MELEILYEDDALLAVNKPAGVVVHPTYKNVGGTLLDAVRAHAGPRDDGHNPTIVGRLDKGTSGIVVIAKASTVHARLQQQLRSDAEKDYLAVVEGAVHLERGEIDVPLLIDPADRRRVIVARVAGLPSVTRFERLAVSDSRSLLRCRLITGRRHQIRVHLAARGWPLVGDATYGRPLEGFPRHALHAWRLSFVHPMEERRLTIEAPLPDAFQQLVNSSGLGAAL